MEDSKLSTTYLQNEFRDDSNSHKNDNFKDQQNSSKIGSHFNELAQNLKKLRLFDRVKNSKIHVSNETIVSLNKNNPSKSYKLIRNIGSGSFGEVFLVENFILGNKRAMKRMLKSNCYTVKDEKQLLKEVQLLKKINHPNIVKIYEYYNTTEAIYIVTEYCKEGDLFDKLRTRLSEEKISFIFYQLLYAVFYLHLNKIIHRDIKLENILVDEVDKNDYYYIKLIDFGAAKIMGKNENKEKNLVGSYYYIAPEVLKFNPVEKSDLWSCGVILYVLVTGTLPFDFEDDRDTCKAILRGKYSKEKQGWKNSSDEVRDLIERLLERDVSKRLSAFEALNHDWFKKMKTKNLLTKIDVDLLRKYVLNIKNYKYYTKLQHSVLAFIFHNLEPNDDIKAAQKIFRIFDQNLEGTITKEELKIGLSLYLPESESIEDTNEIFLTLDPNDSGKLVYEDFLRACIDKNNLFNEKILKFAFDYFDNDSSGKISLENLLLTFNIASNTEDSEILKKSIQIFDIEGDGEISFDEFKLMLID